MNVTATRLFCPTYSTPGGDSSGAIPSGGADEATVPGGSRPVPPASATRVLPAPVAVPGTPFTSGGADRLDDQGPISRGAVASGSGGGLLVAGAVALLLFIRRNPRRGRR